MHTHIPSKPSSNFHCENEPLTWLVTPGGQVPWGIVMVDPLSLYFLINASILESFLWFNFIIGSNNICCGHF